MRHNRNVSFIAVESGGSVGGQRTYPAIYNAIGKWINDYPTTPDKVLKALWKM